MRSDIPLASARIMTPRPVRHKFPQRTVVVFPLADRQLTAIRLHLSGYLRPKASNSPFLAPPIKASHSADVNCRTEPFGWRLLRTATPPPGRSATSTQLPLAKLSELLTHRKPDPSDAFSGIRFPTATSLIIDNCLVSRDYVESSPLTSRSRWVNSVTDITSTRDLITQRNDTQML